MIEEEFLSFGIDIDSEIYKKIPEENLSHRKLLFAIIQQAVREAFSKNSKVLCTSARKFLDKHNPIFCFYCQLIDIDAELLANRITFLINQRADHEHKRDKKSNSSCGYGKLARSKTIPTRKP